MKTMNLSNLPNEILLEIFTFFKPGPDTTNIECSCKAFKTLIDSAYFWREQLKHEYPNAYDKTIKETKEPNNASMWKNTYKKELLSCCYIMFEVWDFKENYVFIGKSNEKILNLQALISGMGGDIFKGMLTMPHETLKDIAEANQYEELAAAHRCLYGNRLMVVSPSFENCTFILQFNARAKYIKEMLDDARDEKIKYEEILRYVKKILPTDGISEKCSEYVVEKSDITYSSNDDKHNGKRDCNIL